MFTNPDERNTMSMTEEHAAYFEALLERCMWTRAHALNLEVELLLTDFGGPLGAAASACHDVLVAADEPLRLVMTEIAGHLLDKDCALEVVVAAAPDHDPAGAL